jgi:hypothetical protein
MKRSLIAAAAVGLLALTGGTARAQGGPDACTGWAAQASLPALSQSYAYTPGGCGPYGYGPLMQPFGNGQAGAAAYYGPPGAVAAYGPLGPAPTASLVYGPLPAPPTAGPSNPSTGPLLAAAQQQAELATLNARYANSAAYQYAAATRSHAYARQAAAVFERAKADCGPAPGPLPAS